MAEFSTVTKDPGLSFSIVIDNEVISIPIRDILELYFIEDIYSFNIIGKCTFIDTLGIFELGPTVGGEDIVLAYGVDSIKLLSLKLYKIKKVQAVSPEEPSSTTVEIFFVDSFYFDLHSKFHSLSLDGIKFSKAIETIGLEHCEIEEWKQFEESKELITGFDTNYWSPAQCFKWLMKRCSNQSDRVPGYCLYSNTNFDQDDTNNYSWNFVSLNSLLKQQELLSIDGMTDEDKIYVLKSSQNIQFINGIISYNINNVDWNNYKSLAGGVVTGYDGKRKKLINLELSYQEAVNKFTFLGKKTLFPQTLVEDIEKDERAPWMTGESDEEIIKNMWYDNWIKEYCMQNTVTITVKGHEHRYAGGMIEINWPSLQKENDFNKHYMGKYLIKSITHYFAPKQPFYRQKMVLMKNAYFESDNEDLYIVPKDNQNL